MSAAERASEASSAERAVRSERMGERCERRSERRSEWPSTQRVDFIFILQQCAMTAEIVVVVKRVDDGVWSHGS